ncbi:MAG: murein biosynthesis integral membrane protein MurJ [Chloroflexi bacterium]|nr:murein biosynthesis integral membrane protein MurJ [Chloroflexota bacterium]
MRIPRFRLSHFARSSLIVSAFFGLDKVIGFVRTLIVNRLFGLSYELDVFNAANNIPDLLSALISGGALGVALIPVLSQYLQTRGRAAAWDLFSRIINLAFIVTGLLAIVVALLAPVLVRTVIVPGFPPEQQSLTVELMRLDLVAIMIFSLSGLIMASLQANQHFLLPALAPGLYNVGQIFGALVLADRMGLGIHGLVYGVIIGAVLHLGIQLPGLIRYGFRWTAQVNVRHPGVTHVLHLLAPRIATMFFIQMFFIVRDNLASRMGEGAVTALNLGWFIMQVPETLLGTAIAITLLPTISELFAEKNLSAYKRTLNGAVNAVLALTIPAGLLLAAAVRPLVQAAFNFDPADTETVVLATRTYLLGLTGHALLEIGARAFYSQQDAKTPLIAAALNSTAYMILAVLLSRQIGFVGIALTNSIVFTLEALALLWLLNRRLGSMFQVASTLKRVLAGSALGAGLIYLALRALPDGGLGTFTLGAAAAALLLAGGALALPFIWPELKGLMRLGERADPEYSAQSVNVTK